MCQQKLHSILDLKLIPHIIFTVCTLGEKISLAMALMGKGSLQKSDKCVSKKLWTSAINSLFEIAPIFLTVSSLQKSDKCQQKGCEYICNLGLSWRVFWCVSKSLWIGTIGTIGTLHKSVIHVFKQSVTNIFTQLFKSLSSSTGKVSFLFLYKQPIDTLHWGLDKV